MLHDTFSVVMRRAEAWELASLALMQRAVPPCDAMGDVAFAIERVSERAAFGQRV